MTFQKHFFNFFSGVNETRFSRQTLLFALQFFIKHAYADDDENYANMNRQKALQIFILIN